MPGLEKQSLCLEGRLPSDSNAVPPNRLFLSRGCPFGLPPVLTAAAHCDRGAAKQRWDQGKLPSADTAILISSSFAAGFTLFISALSLNMVQAEQFNILVSPQFSTFPIQFKWCQTAFIVISHRHFPWAISLEIFLHAISIRVLSSKPHPRTVEKNRINWILGD